MFNAKTEAAKDLPVLIFDEQKKVIGKSSGGAPEFILKENNVKIYPEDRITTSLILDPVTDGGAGEKIVIKRAPVFNIEVDGSVLVVRSWAKSIGEVLKGRVSLGAKDIIEPSLNSIAIPGEIKITRINVIETEETASIPFETYEKPDYFVAKGTMRVTTKGINGQKLKKFRVRYKNGVEESRTLLSESIVKKPTTEVVKKGFMPSGERYFNRTYWEWMVAGGTKYGVSPLDLFKVASCESRVNPNSVNRTGGYYGMFQYNLYFWQQASTAAGFSGASWNNAQAQIYTTARWVSKYGWGRWGCKP